MSILIPNYQRSIQCWFPSFGRLPQGKAVRSGWIDCRLGMQATFNVEIENPHEISSVSTTIEQQGNELDVKVQEEITDWLSVEFSVGDFIESLTEGEVHDLNSFVSAKALLM